MQNQAQAQITKWFSSALTGGLCFLAACGDKSAEDQGSAQPRKPPGATSPADTEAAGEAAGGTQQVATSVFSVTNNWRDPFFPKSSRQAAASSGTVTNAPVNVVAHLRAGFQGTIGSAEDRLALIHNTILETGKSAVITFRVNGKEQQVTVRCRRVLRNGVELEVPGQPEPVIITGTAN